MCGCVLMMAAWTQEVKPKAEGKENRGEVQEVKEVAEMLGHKQPIAPCSTIQPLLTKLSPLEHR